MPRFFSVLLTGSLLLGSGAFSQEDHPDSLATDPVQIQTTLANGMQVVVRSLPQTALTRIGMFYAAGSALEPDSLAGLAHFSEHLLTESSLNHPEGDLIRQHTLYATYRNAYTGPAYIQFDTECLPVFLLRILALEADRQRGVVTDSVSFAREKGVVLEELAMRQRLTPTWEFLESVSRACYPGHPYSRPVGGTAETVSRIGLKDFMEFQKTFIRPERSALVVQGPLDPEKTVAEIERIFDTGTPSSAVFADPPPYPDPGKEQVILDSHDHTGQMICLAFRVSLEDDRDAAWAAILPALMNEGGIYLREFGYPAESVFMLLGISEYSRPSTKNEDHWGTIYYDFDPEQQALRHMEYKWEQIYDLVEGLWDPEDFADQLKGALESLEETRRHPGRATGLGTALVNGNEYLTLRRIREILQDVGPADFQAFMQRWIHPDRAVVGVSHGRDSERDATVVLTRKKPAPFPLGAESPLESLTRTEIEPVLQEYASSALFQLERWVLSNGIPVTSLVIPDSELWSLAGIRTFKGIKDMRPGKKPGIAQVFSLVINYDDRQRRNPEGPTILKPLPYDLRIHLDWNSMGLFAQGPGEKVADILEQVDRRFSSRELNTMRWHSVTRWGDSYLQGIRERKVHEAVAWRWGQILGPKHPSLGQWAPDPEAFTKVNYQDLVNLHKKYVQKTGNLQLLVAGSAPAQQLRKNLDRTFGEHDQWKATKASDPPEVQVQGIRGKIVSDLTRGDVLLSLTFPPRAARAGRHPVIAALALESALGQVLTSLIREQEGLTYGVSVGVLPLAHHFLWEITVTCQPGQAQIVFPFVKEVVARITAEGFSEDEMARARLQLTGEAIGSLSDQESGLGYLRRLSELGEIPLDPLRELFLVSTAEVNDLAKAVLDPDSFVFTATGPMFEEDLEEFDLR